MDYTTLWTSDFLSGTHPLSPEARGVYITLICHFNNKDRVVPDDDRYLARLCNMSTRRYKSAKRALIDGDFMEVRDGFIWIEKSSKQWEKDQSFSNSQRLKAQKKHRYDKAKLLAENNTNSAGAGAGGHASPYPSPLRVGEDSLGRPKKSSPLSEQDSNGSPFDKVEGGQSPDYPVNGDVVAMVDIWNDFAQIHGLDKAEPLDPGRRKKALQRLKECGGLDGWRKVVLSIAESPWLLGKNDDRWEVSFGWLLIRERLTRVREGNYIRKTASRSMM